MFTYIIDYPNLNFGVYQSFIRKHFPRKFKRVLINCLSNKRAAQLEIKLQVIRKYNNIIHVQMGFLRILFTLICIGTIQLHNLFVKLDDTSVVYLN